MLKVNFDYLWQIPAAGGMGQAEWKRISERAEKVVGDFRKQRPGYLRILDDERRSERHKDLCPQC